MKAIIIVTLTLCLFASMLEAQRRCGGPGQRPPPPPPAYRNQQPPPAGNNQPPPPPPKNSNDPSPNNNPPQNNDTKPNVTGGTTSGNGQGLGNVSGGDQNINITNNPTVNIQNYYGTNSTNPTNSTKP